ncbi:MAG: hypothetical protein RMJ38_05935 [candidate division WOR-3 bacterium]|nr:hypothetical protein [candidate division WOR-3 bacterium]MDW8150963.1 hypothetical protein [candidate division WOR-3 bacterium]
MLKILFGFAIKLNHQDISLLKILELESGNIIAIGNYTNQNNVNEIAILKINSSGNIILSKSIYANNYISFTDAVYRNGKIYILGTINIQTQGNNLLFIVIDTNSNIISSKYYPILNYEIPSAISMINNNLYIVGIANPNNFFRPYFMITDTLGNPRFLKLGYIFYTFTNLKNLFFDGKHIYVYGDYYEGKRISAVFKFDTLLNLMEIKKIHANFNLPLLGFFKNDDSIFLLTDKHLIIFRSDWKPLSIKNLSMLSPKFINFQNSIEIFGIYNNKPFYYVLDRNFPMLRYANINASNIKYAKNFVIFNNTQDYIFKKNSVCHIFQDQLFYLSDISLNITIENEMTNLITFSIPYVDIQLSIKELNILFSDICNTSVKEEKFLKQIGNEILFLEDGEVKIIKVDGSVYGKYTIKKGQKLSLKKGVYIVLMKTKDKIHIKKSLSILY